MRANAARASLSGGRPGISTRRSRPTALFSSASFSSRTASPMAKNSSRRRASGNVLFRGDLRRGAAEARIELASLLPAHHVERFDEFADAVDFGAEQAELDDLFVAEVFFKVVIDLVLVD